jgi:hypothetical protein
MNLSPQTIAILTNFSKISRGIFVSPGNILKIRSQAVYAEATVADSFPTEFALDDIQDFLRMIGLFREPIVSFGSKELRIAEADATAETGYAYAGAGVVQPCPNRKTLDPPEEAITFALTREQWATLQNALGIAVGQKKKNRMPFLRITSDGQAICLSTQRNQQSTTNEYAITVDAQTDGHKCRIMFSTDNLPILPGSYKVTITPKCMQLENTSGFNLVYWIAREPTPSSWGGKRSYQVRVSKSVTQRSYVLVDAHSPEEAEGLVRQKRDEDLEWTQESWPAREIKVVVG